MIMYQLRNPDIYKYKYIHICSYKHMHTHLEDQLVDVGAAAAGKNNL